MMNKRWLFWLFALVVLFWGLGSAPLTDVDEGAFAEATREMLARGDFISPWLLDAPRFDKPVLIHWLQMAAMHIFGINAFAARLPSALAGLLWIAVIFRWRSDLSARLNQLPGAESSAPFAILIAASSIAIPAIARASTADALLNALLALSLYLLWRALIALNSSTLLTPSTQLNQSQARTFSRLAAIVIGLGLLTKGPIAVLVPGAVSLLAAIFMRVSPKWLKLAFDPMAWLIVLVIALPWYFLQYQAQGMAFIHGFLGTHNVGRFTHTMHGFHGGLWYYPLWLTISLLPWLPLLLRALVKLVTERHGVLRQRDLLMAWMAPLFVIGFFSMSATKLPHYGFYGLTGLFVILSIQFSSDLQQQAAHNQFTQNNRRNFVLDKLFVILLLLGLASYPYWWHYLPLVTPDLYYRQVLIDAGQLLAGRSWIWMLPLLGAVATLFTLWLPQRRYGVQGLLLGVAIFAISLQLGLVTTVIQAQQNPIYKAGQQLAQNAKNNPDQSVISWRLPTPSLSFAANMVIPVREPTRGDRVVLYAKNQADLRAFLAASQPGASINLVWQQAGIEIVDID